jgi:hypothetical protein
MLLDWRLYLEGHCVRKARGFPLLITFVLRQGLAMCPAGLKLLIFLPQHLECWDYRCAPPHPATRVLLGVPKSHGCINFFNMKGQV